VEFRIFKSNNHNLGLCGHADRLVFFDKLKTVNQSPDFRNCDPLSMFEVRASFNASVEYQDSFNTSLNFVSNLCRVW
jgi:hypothetical protein